MIPTDTGDVRPLQDAWVTLHRVGIRSAGPVDSVRTARDGSYALDYSVPADDSSSWVLSVLYAGIAHFSQSLTLPVVSGEAGEITVFDTSSAPASIHVRGRHLVVFAARPGAPRTVMEVYELENDGVRTAIAAGERPVWSAPFPVRAAAPRLDDGSLSSEAVRFERSRVLVFAPITPGLRQIAFRYELGGGAFPLAIPLESEAEFLEVLVEEPLARVDLPGGREVERVTTEGHQFRRFTARHVDSGTVVRIDVPSRAQRRRGPAVALVTGISAVAMAATLLFGLRPAT